MITDEQIDKVLALFGFVGQGFEDGGELKQSYRDDIRQVLEPILAAERNRLLDECLGICDKVYSQQAEYNSIGMNAAANIKSSIEDLRHE